MTVKVDRDDCSHERGREESELFTVPFLSPVFRLVTFRPSQQLLSTTTSSPFPSFIDALSPIASNAFQYPRRAPEGERGEHGHRLPPLPAPRTAATAVAGQGSRGGTAVSGAAHDRVVAPARRACFGVGERSSPKTKRTALLLSRGHPRTQTGGRKPALGREGGAPLRAPGGVCRLAAAGAGGAGPGRSGPV